MERRLCYTFEIGKFTDILNECFCYHQCQNEKVRTNATIYGHGLLKIHDIGGQRSLQLLLPPCHIFHHCSLATQDLLVLNAIQSGISYPLQLWPGPHWRDEI